MFLEVVNTKYKKKKNKNNHQKKNNQPKKQTRQKVRKEENYKYMKVKNLSYIYRFSGRFILYSDYS